MNSTSGASGLAAATPQAGTWDKIGRSQRTSRRMASGRRQLPTSTSALGCKWPAISQATMPPNDDPPSTIGLSRGMVAASRAA